MATYKVIQDIEAEDKLVGPLTLRQFIYGAIAALCAYLSFIAISKGVTLLLIIFVPPMLFAGFFAFPFGRDQPTEVWALAKIRFYLKSRKRLWNQSGARDLVTITAPKHVEREYTNGLSQHEVQSRLTALASTLDSRGWAVKNVNTNLTTPDTTMTLPASDRLFDPGNIPQPVPTIDVTAADDMLDENNNPRAHQLQEMVAQSTSSHRQQLVSQMKQAINAMKPKQEASVEAPADYWFMNKPVAAPQPSSGKTSFTDAQVVHAGETEEEALQSQPVSLAANEEALAERLHQLHQKSQMSVSSQHLKTIQPLGVQDTQTPATIPPTPAPQPTAPPVTPPTNPATISLASNNDLNIATIARIANKQDEDTGEVVISLHNHS